MQKHNVCQGNEGGCAYTLLAEESVMHVLTVFLCFGNIAQEAFTFCKLLACFYYVFLFCSYQF